MGHRALVLDGQVISPKSLKLAEEVRTPTPTPNTHTHILGSRGPELEFLSGSKWLSSCARLAEPLPCREVLGFLIWKRRWLN